MLFTSVKQTERTDRETKNVFMFGKRFCVSKKNFTVNGNLLGLDQTGHMNFLTGQTVQILLIFQTSGPDVMSGRALQHLEPTK